MAESDKPVRAHVVVHGRVQGVWFRGRTRNEALRQSLTGWVRNRPDGTVEAVFVGTTLIVTAAFWLWFLFIAGSPLPNQ